MATVKIDYDDLSKKNLVKLCRDFDRENDGELSKYVDKKVSVNPMYFRDTEVGKSVKGVTNSIISIIDTIADAGIIDQVVKGFSKA